MEYVHSKEDSNAVVKYTVEKLKEHLKKGERVLWLLSGGSAIDSEIEIAEGLEGTDITKLSVSLTDERFGPVGHRDENWKQLLDKGFAITGTDVYRPLIGQDAETTNRAFGAWLEEHITEADYTIAMFGMGPDGHTAGIKPESPAVNSSSWSVEYPWQDFDRMTMTFNAIKLVDLAVIRIMGEDKFPAIKDLLELTLSLEKQPAQILKQVKQGILFTDYNKEVS